MSAQHEDSGFGIINWSDEAAAVISDVKGHVRHISISRVLQPTEFEIYLNCETLEGKRCTIQLSSAGFQIVSNTFDKIDELNGFPYETPYALLNELSPGYTNSFSEELSKSLSNLRQ